MKKIFYASLAVTLLISTAISCKKKTPATPFTYSITGLDNISLNAGDSATMNLHVTTLTGTAENVILAVGGLPPYVTGTITPSTGKPDYDAQLKIVAAGNATPGTSALSITGTSASTGAKPYTTNLTVNAKPDCSADVEGIYSCSEACSVGGDQYTVVISATSQTNQVTVNNIYDEGFVVNAQLDCTAHTLTIPLQTFNTTTISGTGTYSGNTVTIHYTITNTQTNTSNTCTMTLTK